jgi:hypothetical protein
MRNSELRPKKPEEDLFDDSSLLEVDDDYAMIEHQLEKQRQLEAKKRS